jgi:class 3 adenylate cyclase/ABC-type transport system substrate-binding protein
VTRPNQRRLAAILFSDIQGYSRQMDQDEAGALARLEVHNRYMRAAIEAQGGREVKTVGDAFMVEFRSAVAAVTCALDVLAVLEEHNGNASEAIRVRLGVHSGDVIEQQGDLFGETVNIAARLEPVAPVGAVCVSDAVFRQVLRKVDATASDLGVRSLKNMPSMHLWALTPAPGRLEPPSTAPVEPTEERGPRPWKGPLLGLLAVGVAAGLAALWMAGPQGQQAESQASMRVLRVGFGGEWGPMEVFSQNVSVSHDVAGILTETLVWMAEDGTVQPAALGAWDVHDGGRRLTLRLAEDVWVHPHPCVPVARPATGADVRASLELARDALGLAIDRVEEVDGGAVVHRTLPSPFPMHELVAVPLLPAEAIRCEDGPAVGQLAGTGPYRMVGPHVGEVMRLERAQGRGGVFDALEIRPIPLRSPKSARAVAAGALDLILMWRPSEVVDGVSTASPTLKPEFAEAGVRMTAVQSSGVIFRLAVAFLEGDGPWSDPRVRRALALGADRGAIAPLYPGENTPSGRFFEPRWLGFDPGQRGLVHDPAAAARALVDAGFPGGEGLPPLVLGVKPERRPAADALKRQLEALGIELDLRLLNMGSMSTMVEDGRIDATLAQVFDRTIGTDPFPIVVNGDWSSLADGSAEIEAVAAAAGSELDRSARGRLYAQWERKMLEQLPYIPLCVTSTDNPSLFWLHRDDLVIPFVDPVEGRTQDVLSSRWWRRLGRPQRRGPRRPTRTGL